MRRIFLLIMGLFLIIPAFAQIDFNVLFSKKKLKRSASRIYAYERSWSEFVCLSGDCENGQGIFRSKGTKFTCYAKGQFKDGKLNGPGTIYLFNYKRDNLSRKGFDEEIQKGTPTFNYFSSERCPDEIFKGEFKDNILTEGQYTYYGTGEGREYIYQRMTMNYMNSLEPLTDYSYKKDLFYYQCQGQFKKAFYTDCDIDHPNGQAIIACRAHKSVVERSDKKGVFVCKQYRNNELVKTSTLKADEGKRPFILNISSKPKPKRDPNKPIRINCHICRGSGKTKRRVWVVRDFTEVRMRNGYKRKKLIRQENYVYTPGASGPPSHSGKIGESRTRKLEDIVVPCSTCSGKGYHMKIVKPLYKD